MTVHTSYIGSQQPQHVAPLTRQPHHISTPRHGTPPTPTLETKNPAWAPESYWVLSRAPTRHSQTSGMAKLKFDPRLFQYQPTSFLLHIRNYLISKQSSITEFKGQITTKQFARFTMAISYKAGNTTQNLKWRNSTSWKQIKCNRECQSCFATASHVYEPPQF